MTRRLHIGAGNDIKPGWVNHDLAPLPGVDVVHDLEIFPWPWADEEFDEICMRNVLEHVSDTIKTLEEIYRITRKGGSIYIEVPYWNSFEAITDPTHKRFFNELTFEFFDPSYRRCQSRPYYSSARFSIKMMEFEICPFSALGDTWLKRYFKVQNPILKKILTILAHFFCNVIIGLNLRLERI